MSPPVVPVPGCKKSAYDVIAARKDTSTYLDLAKKSGAALKNTRPAERHEKLHGYAAPERAGCKSYNCSFCMQVAHLLTVEQ